MHRWTIHTTDDRFGDGLDHPYVVEGVTEARQHDGVLTLFAGQQALGSFPLANITDKVVEEYGTG